MIIQGDCLEEMKKMEVNSIDTIITDPPYGLSFMGKKWDYDVPGVEMWQEALRVTKPGGTMLCFAGSRTQHRMAVNVEDAGWILKDCIMWLYGSGFPKATDISKQLDKTIKISECCGSKVDKAARRIGDMEYLCSKCRRHCKLKERKVVGKSKDSYNRKSGGIFVGENEGERKVTEPSTDEAKLWNGWKSHGLKPAYEPILVAMKPNDGTYANNALKHGVSGLNIDGGRVEYTSEKDKKEGQSSRPKSTSKGMQYYSEGEDNKFNRNDRSKITGRFPANLLLSCSCDLQGKDLFDILNTCQLNHSNSSVNSVEKKRLQDDTTSSIKRLYSVVGTVNMPILEKILGNVLGDINRMDILCLEETLTESINTSLNMYISGKKNMEKYQKIMKCITSTVNEMITDWKICSVCREQTTGALLIWVIKDILEQKSGGSHKADCPVRMLDEQSGVLKSGSMDSIAKPNQYNTYGKMYKRRVTNPASKGGASRFFYCAKASKAERNAGCEGMEEKPKNTRRGDGNALYNSTNFQPMANTHPTVKPLKLMEYLCTLTKTPTGGLVLDPFMGSGTTGIACKLTGREFIGIEREKEYCKIAEARIKSIPDRLL